MRRRQVAAMATDRVRATGRRPLPLGTKLGFIVGGAVVVSGFTALANWRDHHAFVINVSESLPNWAFLVRLGQFPKRGEFAVFDPGRDPLTIKHFGAKPSPFAKIVYGVPGDVLTREGNQVFVNGAPIVKTKPLTKQGEVLLPGPTGVIPRGCVFAGSPHKDGFDSRYKAIGFVCSDRLLGVGEAVL
jgi:conjugal transfer pilin signal peptidase TrbI